MNRTLKAIIVAVVLIFAGAVLAGCSLWGMDGAWDMLTGSGKLVTSQETITGDFTNIDIDIFSVDLELLPSPDGTCYYVAKTYENMFCTAEVENGTLKIGQEDNRKWHQHVGIYWEETSLKLYLSKDAYNQLTVTGDTSDVTIPNQFTFESATIDTDTGDVTLGCQVDQQINITSDTGDITVKNATSETINVTTDTGDIHLDSVTCDSISVSTNTGFVRIQNADVAQMLSAASDTGDKYFADVQCDSLKIESNTGDNALRNLTAAGNAKLESDTGDWELENVIVSGNAELESDTGDWEFDRFDAANITIDTDTGDVEGTFLSEKIFFIDTDTGDVEVPRTTTGGKCEITTNTGDIEIDIMK